MCHISSATSHARQPAGSTRAQLFCVVVMQAKHAAEVAKRAEQMQDRKASAAAAAAAKAAAQQAARQEEAQLTAKIQVRTQLANCLPAQL